jgi:hypothetical protein
MIRSEHGSVASLIARLLPPKKQLGSCSATPDPLSFQNCHTTSFNAVCEGWTSGRLPGKRLGSCGATPGRFPSIDGRACIDVLAGQGERFGVHYLAWCLMSNHAHLIAIPEQESSLARGIGEAHRRYTRYINFREGTKNELRSNSQVTQRSRVARVALPGTFPLLPSRGHLPAFGRALCVEKHGSSWNRREAMGLSLVKRQVVRWREGGRSAGRPI